MTHNQEQLRVLGRIVASNKKIKLSEILIEYENNLRFSVYNLKPTIKTHSKCIITYFWIFFK